MIEEKNSFKSLATAAMLGASSLSTNPNLPQEVKSNDPYEMVYLNHINKPFDLKTYKDNLYKVYNKEVKNGGNAKIEGKNYHDYIRLYLIKKNKLKDKKQELIPKFIDWYNKNLINVKQR